MRSVLACLMSATLIALVLTSAGLARSTDEATTIQLRVRVEDRTGKPLAGAKGAIFKMTPPRTQSGRRDAEAPITKGGTASPSGKDGYVATQPLPAKSAYVLEIQADGFAPDLTRWSHPQQSGTVELPAVQLRRLGAISGTVVDRRGHAVPNATVIQAGDGTKRLETTTDKDGKFRLDGVPEGQVIVCFEAAGCRFDGALLKSPSEGARVELERLDEANPRGLKLVDPVSQWTAQQRAAFIKKFLEPQIARVLAQSTIAENDQLILLIATRLDPERVLSRIDQFKFARPYMVYGVRYSIGAAFLAQGKPEAALAAIDKFKDPQARLQAYLYWFESDPAKTKYPAAHKLALAKARAILEADTAAPQRSSQLCELGIQLWDMGDHDGARKVFQQCQALLDKIPAERNDKNWLRMQLAIAVSRDDLERAKKLASDVEPAQSMRLAAQIARHHPKEVESFLKDVPGELSLLELRGVANQLPNVCLRVARQDPAAAERLLLKYAQVPQPKTDAEKMFGLGGSFGLNLSKEFIEFQVAKLKATCYGLIAEGALARDQAAARHALSEAIELVKPLREGFIYPMSQEYHGPAMLMAMLVPVAQRLDPALAREVFWRALSVRVAATGESREREKIDVDTCLLANIIRHFDREIAASLMEPVLVRAGSRSFAGMGFYYWMLRAQTLESPDRAMKWADSFCDLPSLDGTVPRDAARRAIANIVALPANWEGDQSQRLQDDLGAVQNFYGVYVDRN